MKSLLKKAPLRNEAVPRRSVFALWSHMTLRAELGIEKGNDICPSSDLILSRLYLQISRRPKSHSLSVTHTHTCNCAKAHAQRQRARLSSSLTSRTLCPSLVWSSLSVSDSLSVLHTHGEARARTHTSMQPELLHNSSSSSSSSSTLPKLL